MKRLAKGHSKTKSLLKNSGRVHLVLLSLLIIVTGLLLGRWWWQLGVVMLVVLVTESIFRYSTMD